MYDYLIGQKFNYLTIKIPYIKRDKMVYCITKCDCGKDFEVCLYNVIHSKTRSCGCILYRRNDFLPARHKSKDKFTKICPEFIESLKKDLADGWSFTYACGKLIGGTKRYNDEKKINKELEEIYINHMIKKNEEKFKQRLISQQISSF